MIVSYNKLQEYFDDKLSEPNKIAELLTFHSYEVEDIKKENGDYLFDIDILPNRADDSKDEVGVARELSAILKIPLNEKAPKYGKSDIKIDITVFEINRLLGSDISFEEIKNILKRLRFSYKIIDEKIIVTPPIDRTDIVLKADLTEEIGRIYGYENIKETLPKESKEILKINKKFYYANKIKNFLVDEGFSEVYTYTFRNKGDIEIIKPVASDKNFLRTDLREGFIKTISDNYKNMPLFEGNEIMIFEIGNVFTKDGEYTSFAMGWTGKNKSVIDKLSEFLGVKIDGSIEKNIFEINFDELLKKLPEPNGEYEKIEKKEVVMFKRFSQYPFILRDIAIFAPNDEASSNILEIIKKEAGKLLVNIKLFDKFKKDNKTSYAFNLVFQSQEKTLSDEEVNKITEKITNVLNSNSNWEVR